jgi:hypothetical protein
MGQRWIPPRQAVLAALLLALLLTGWLTWQTARVRTVRVTIGANVVTAELAAEPRAQQRGLAGRPSLDPNHGMLFVYQTPGRYPFWMKGMRFPLDFIWIDEGYVVGVTPAVRPETYPATFAPPRPVRYILEVNAGWAAAHDVSAGERVTLEPPS